MLSVAISLMPHFFAQVADHLGGIVEAAVHLRAGLLEVLRDGLPEFVEALLEGADLLLEEQQRLIGLLRLVAFTQDHGDERRDRDECEQANDKDDGFHATKLTFGHADGNSLVRTTDFALTPF